MARRGLDEPARTGVSWREGAGRFSVQAGAGLVVLLAVLLRTYPISFWEFDELLFAAGVVRFQPLLHHPHPPGYPVLIGLGKIADLVVRDPFAALVALSVVASLAGFVALACAFRNLLGDGRLAVFGALLFYLSPGMLVHASLPLSDPPALALLALTFYGASRVERPSGGRDALVFGAAASLAVGCRPQLAVLVVPLVVFTFIRTGSWRRGSLVLSAFAVVSLYWLIPLVVATGGVGGFLRYQLGQASVVAATDANLARAGRTWADLVLRFVAHPWGMKLLSMPVLALATAGAAAAARRLELRLLPILAACGLYLAFAITTMDPADGVRYALPAAMGTALLAARGMGWLSARPRWRPALAVLVVAYGGGSLAYVAPIVFTRHRVPSPPAQAAEYANRHLPPGTVILYEASLWPHATELVSRFRTLPVTPGLNAYFDRPNVPLYLFADGGSERTGAQIFSWPESDAYGKLTRDHYRVVSLIPLPPERRYRALMGVYRPNRTPGGQHWRWLDTTAEIELPDVGARSAVVRLALPPDYPLGSNDVTVSVDGAPAAHGTVRPGEPLDLTVALKAGTNVLRIASSKSFVPAKLDPRRFRDPRRLGVMLVSVEQGG